MTYVQLLMWLSENNEAIIKEGLNFVITSKRSYRRSGNDYKFYPTTENELELVETKKIEPSKQTAAAMVKFAAMEKSDETKQSPT